MRPLVSHEVQGREAYIEGIDINDNPYDPYVVAGLSWRLGWLKSRRSDPLADSEEGLDELEIEQADADRSFEIRRIGTAIQVRMDLMRSMLPSPEDLAVHEKGYPIANWPKNCYAIATSLKESGLIDHLVPQFGHYQLCYGSYQGAIAPTSVFQSAFASHGWIEFPREGLIVDPTRWVFFDSEPAISVVMIDEYDLGASRLNLNHKMAPAVEEGDRLFDWDASDMKLTNRISAIMGKNSKLSEGIISLPQAFWLSKVPLEQLGDGAAALYQWYKQADQSGLVPIDLRTYVEDMQAHKEAAEAEMQPSL